MNKGGRVKSSERNIKSFPHSTLWPRAAHTQAFPSLRSEHHTPLLIHPDHLPQPVTDQHCDPLLPLSCPQPMISSPLVDPAHFWCLCCVCLGSLGFLAIIFCISFKLFISQCAQMGMRGCSWGACSANLFR